jgi:hypothetical protein
VGTQPIRNKVFHLNRIASPDQFCIGIVPVGSYEFVPGSHPFVGGLCRSIAVPQSGFAGDGAELCRFRPFKRNYAKALDEVFTRQCGR